MLAIAVLVSGSGSNLQSIIEACQSLKIDARINGVFSNRSDAYALERAAAAGIPAQALLPRDYETSESYERALGDAIETCGAGLVVLAGFMRILGPGFIERFNGHIMNIHPSLLPLYPGLDTHQRALEDGAAEHGATVHFVTTELDAGPIIIQARVDVYEDDTVGSLQQRVLGEEHKIYPRAIGWFAEGKINFQNPRPE